MTYRLFGVFLVALFILVLGATGALTVVPAGTIASPSDPSTPSNSYPFCLDGDVPGTLHFTLTETTLDSDFLGLGPDEDVLFGCGVVGERQRLVSGLPFPLNISGTGNFVDVSGVYDPATGTYTGNGIGTVGGFPNVTVVMQLTIVSNGNITGTYAMGAGGELPAGVPTVYSVTGTLPLATPTPTPSPTATPVPTATPTGQQVTWADNNCKDGVNPVDSLFVLRGDAGLSTDTGLCPPMGADIEVLNASPHIWGNVDCKDGMTPVDSLKILRYDAGLSASQEQPCPAMGSAVTIVLF